MALPKGTTTAETLSVNGVVLNTYAKNIESLTGRLRTPGRRSSNVVVPGRHGTVRASAQKFHENVIALPMWVVGGTDEGKIPSGSTAREEFFKRMDELTHLFLGSSGPLDVRHTLPDGSVRQCFADVLDAIDFTTESADPMAKFGVSMTIPGAFWQDLDELSDEQVANVNSLTFSKFEGATAPMEELRARIVGPWNNPRLTFADGSWVQYSESFAAGQGVVIDSELWSLSGVGGYVPVLSSLTYSGESSRWMSIPPSGSSALPVTISGSSRTPGTRLTLEGRRKYLVG